MAKKKSKKKSSKKSTVSKKTAKSPKAKKGSSVFGSLKAKRSPVKARGLVPILITLIR